ncbi:S41 family peptidase [Riemerella anatipestifer]|uniref:S41 family peptidase n=1 Tax=Riemerella anatipestifer TaxID=34085 RepID=UPI0030BEC4B7
MRKYILTLLLCTLTIFSYCQTKKSDNKYNFDFETTKKGIPTNWDNFGNPNYIISLDSNYVKSGKYAASIEFKEGNPGFKAWGFTLPDNYDGKKITLSGYIKTENVTDGYAGLWMRIDPKIAFDNMGNRGITGTTDWTKYEVTLNMNPQKTKNIVIGGLLVGKGKMWIDDLKITIDGKNLADLKPLERKLLPADKDNEFDNGSNIQIKDLRKTQIENLKVLGLVWGFLKYYHPNIARGQFNWDYELFRILPKILNSKSKKERDEILKKWINKLGSFPQDKEHKIASKEIKIEPDLDWVTKSKLSNELSDILIKVKNANRPKKHYYIDFPTNVKNPDFTNENPYAKMAYPDDGFRLLALFRYWNIIQYYFPYKNLIEEDWKNVLEEFIPKIIGANNKTEYTLCVLELIGRVHDTHANIWGGNPVLREYFGDRYAVPKLKFVENKAAVQDFYDEDLREEKGLQKGDIITKVNGKKVSEIIANNLKITPASNYPTQLRDIARKLLRSNDSLIDINYIRNGTTKNLSLKTYSMKEMNIYESEKKKEYFKMINPEIGYLYLGTIKSEYLPSIFEKLKGTKGLIIDLRCYPSDFVVFTLGKYLMPKPTEFVKFSTGSIQSPGLFTFTKPLEVGKNNKNYYKGKIVILVNETTQSSAEYHAMAFRASQDATVIGSTTAGADGNVSQIYLPGGIFTMISGIGVYYPNGKETQRVGIVPDIKIEPTIEGIKKGKDEVLEKAIEVIKNGL